MAFSVATKLFGVRSSKQHSSPRDTVRKTPLVFMVWRCWYDARSSPDLPKHRNIEEAARKMPSSLQAGQLRGFRTDKLIMTTTTTTTLTALSGLQLSQNISRSMDTGKSPFLQHPFLCFRQESSSILRPARRRSHLYQ